MLTVQNLHKSYQVGKTRYEVLKGISLLHLLHCKHILYPLSHQVIPLRREPSPLLYTSRN